MFNYFSMLNENRRLLISQAFFLNESVPLFLPNAFCLQFLLLVQRTVLERVQNDFLDGPQILFSAHDAQKGEVEVMCKWKCAPEARIIATTSSNECTFAGRCVQLTLKSRRDNRQRREWLRDDFVGRQRV
jgi:hypothetical protein